ncbi:MAG: hypothetical protein LBM68_04445 [Bacteroidales bacterium]|jgi:hypothetical protein|nr:hypothetical protein [Bacteroidales bacterium]
MIKELLKNKHSYQWQFARIGGTNRVVIERGQDLLHLHTLDQKLWTALACPANNLMIDEKTLHYLDADDDGRIRVPEILTAVQWLCAMVSDVETFFKNSSEFSLNNFNENNPDAQTLKNSAITILGFLKASSLNTISTEQTANIEQMFVNTDFNGDGIITTISTTNEEEKKAIETIAACMGSVTDRCGLEGITEEKITGFFTECANYLQWRAIAESNPAEYLPFGTETGELFAIFSGVRNKINDFFFQCKFAQYNNDFANTTLPVNFADILQSPHESELQTIIGKLPVYPISPNAVLGFSGKINPAWETQLLQFYTKIFTKEYSEKSMTEAQWRSIERKFEKYAEWLTQKQGAKVETLDETVISELQQLQPALLALIAKDNEQKQNVDAMFLVDKFVCLHRDIVHILRNFVTFQDFYTSADSAIFSNGTLFIDQRSCSLCIPVQNVDAHTTLASHSGMFLIYCDCTHKQTKEKQSIVTVLTNGDIDNLMVGRNALYYDKNGEDWDATIVKIIDNPISLRQAFWSPYRKISQFVSDQIKKFSSSRANAVEDTMKKDVESATDTLGTTAPTGGTATTASASAAVPFDIGKFVGIFAAIGLAIGAIGGVLVSIVSGFLKLKWWEMPLSIIALMLVISGPAVLVAWFKLRSRNLGPILDANGWAINARAIINIPMGNTLTAIAQIPYNAKINIHDPFAVKTMAWWKKLLIAVGILGIVFGVLWYFGLIQKWFCIGI